MKKKKKKKKKKCVFVFEEFERVNVIDWVDETDLV